MNKFGFVRVSVCSPTVYIGNPSKNVESIIGMIDQLPDSDVIVFPELCMTGYTCADLFRQGTLFEETANAVRGILDKVRNQLVFVGAPVKVNNELFNCAIAINAGRIIGVIPKQNIPNYNEFYESRWFRAADGNEPKIIKFIPPYEVPFGTDLLFQAKDLIVGCEVCEDCWTPIPPSSFQALAGANLLVNLSASNETVAKNAYRCDLVKNQSGRCVAAYAYASAGPTESTTDLVFGGHCLIAENGHILSESPRVGGIDYPISFGPWHTTADVDIEKLQTERRLLTSFGDANRDSRSYRIIEYRNDKPESKDLMRRVDGMPFVPSDENMLKSRCAEVFGIQCCGLAGRLRTIAPESGPEVYIGVSGGLDSTLALLVAAKTYKACGWDLKKIHGITMPGFGTSVKTKKNADKLMEYMEVSSDTVDIRSTCFQTFKDLNHKPFGIDITNLTLEQFCAAIKDVPKEQRHDLVFENVQARIRTMFLMSKGFVIGTGDMSELALGWCTYNGDHMSMYGVNASVPKTLIRWMVKYVADTLKDVGDSTNRLYHILKDIVETTISPELLPTNKEDEIEQSTEDTLGPYELHDFYLANFIRTGFSPKKLLFLASHADFGQKNECYDPVVQRNTLKVFLKRFFSQQFKRSCVPDGPKVGSISLSPRGDWRMASDADPSIWLEGL